MAQLLPSKKLSTNARSQISNLQEGNHYNSKYINNGQQNLLSSRSGQGAKHKEDFQIKCNHCKRVNNLEVCNLIFDNFVYNLEVNNFKIFNLHFL